MFMSRFNYTFDDYELAVARTAIYPDDSGLVYTALGLTGEAGEYAEKIKKYLRDGVLDKKLAAKELGDVLWYITRAAHHLGFSLEDVAYMNINKLADRKDRGVLQGNGDNR